MEKKTSFFARLIKRIIKISPFVNKPLAACLSFGMEIYFLWGCFFSHGNIYWCNGSARTRIKPCFSPMRPFGYKTMEYIHMLTIEGEVHHHSYKLRTYPQLTYQFDEHPRFQDTWPPHHPCNRHMNRLLYY